jgi:glucosamine--fructose-6-phosphate aminotransferase (isomerizing)
VPIEGTVPGEILEGPAAIRATVATTEASARAIAGVLRAGGVKRVWVIGNGTSYHSSLHAAGLARRLAGPDDPIAIPVTAGDFRTFRPRLGRGDVIVGISASGEFRDVLGVFEEVRGTIPTVGIVHVPGSSLTRVADHVVLSAGGASGAPVMTKTFSSTLSATILVLGAILGDAPLAAAIAGLRLAADHAEQAIADAWTAVEAIAAEIADAEHLFVVGGGLAHPAALEAALKLKEMALVHAEASETWEMASGPATIVGPRTVVVSLAPDGPARAATDDVVRHCREWGARVIEVAPSRAVPDSRLLVVPTAVDERFAPLTVVPPVALLAFVLAGLRGATPDRPSWTERYHSQGLHHIVGV